MIASIVSLGTDFVQTGFNESTMHLYKSNLDVNNASKMDVAFKKTSDDSAEIGRDLQGRSGYGCKV